MAATQTIDGLKEQAQKALREARKINEARGENGLSAEDKQKIDGYMSEIDGYKQEWERLEQMEGYDRSLGNQVSGTDDDPETVRGRGQRLPQNQDDSADGWEGTPKDDADFSIAGERQALAAARTRNYNEAFYSYLRARGMTDGHNSELMKVRTMVEGVDADGGYLAPTQLVAGIQREEQVYEQLKPRMNNITTNARSLTFTKGLDTIQMGWVAELGTKPEDQPTFGREVMVPHVGAVVAWISDELLEDETFGLQNYISRLVGEAKVLLEEEAFVSGSGSGRPFGILTRLNAMLGTPQRNTTGTVGALSSDDLINLIYDMPYRYRRNGSWIMGTDTIRQIRLLRDPSAPGQYLWQPGLQAGEPQTVLGYAVTESDAAELNAGVVTGSDVAIFGNLRRYRVMNRVALQVKRLEELRALTDEVGYRFRFRTGGDTELNEAFRTLRVG